MAKLHKNIWITCLSMVTLFVFCMTAYAEDSKDVITRVSVTVDSSTDLDNGPGSVSASADSSRYYVASCDFVDNKELKAGDIPKVLIVLEAEGDCYFSSITSGKVSLEGATYSSAKRSKDYKTLELTVKLKAVKGTLGKVTDAYWGDDSLGKARWEKADNASAYEVKLYRGDTMVHRVEKVSGTSYNFFPYMTKKGSYYFKVRAIPKNNKEDDYLSESDWIESGEQEIATRDAERAVSKGKSDTSSAGHPNSQDQRGWIHNKDGWWYRNADGSYTTNGWQWIDGKWYLFDMAGYMRTGWQTYNDKEYYLTSNGDMKTGWFEDNRRWYYLNENGERTTGWVSLDGKWYYMNPDGTRASGWITWDGNWYYLNPNDGTMMTDTVIDNCYINSNGVWEP